MYGRIRSMLDEEDALNIFQWLVFPARSIGLVEGLAIGSTFDFRFESEQSIPGPRDTLINKKDISKARNEDDAGGGRNGGKVMMETMVIKDGSDGKDEMNEPLWIVETCRCN